jgi:hypothetical protein
MKVIILPGAEFVSLKYGGMVTKDDLLENHCWGIVGIRL